MNIALRHGGIVRVTAAIVGVVMAAYHMWTILTGTPEAIIFRGTHLLFALTLTFLVFRRTADKADEPPSLLDYAFLVLATAPILYLFVNYDYVVNRI